LKRLRRSQKTKIDLSLTSLLRSDLNNRCKIFYKLDSPSKNKKSTLWGAQPKISGQKLVFGLCHFESVKTGAQKSFDFISNPGIRSVIIFSLHFLVIFPNCDLLRFRLPKSELGAKIRPPFYFESRLQVFGASRFS